MSARRNRPSRKSRQAQPAQFELLEERRLLTTLYGGQSLIYRDANDNNVMIIMGGRVQAEFTFAHLTETNPLYPRLGNHVPASAPDNVPGADLFHIYVHYAEEDSYIAIAQINDDGELIPFAENSGDLSVINARTGERVSVSAPEGSGAVYLGARTLDINGTEENESNRPILAASVSPAGRGLLPPQPNNILRAGITVANGHSLGAFLLGGTFTGFANFTGSIGDFYAGWILTGETRGQFTGEPVFRDNFFVNGDARNIISLGAIGTSDQEPDDDDDSPNNITPVYLTGFDLQVRGSLGQVKSGGTISGYVDVVNALGGPFFNRVQREVEFKAADGINTSWRQGRLTGHSLLDNDTFETAQYLGSLNDSFFGDQKGIRLTGTLQGELGLGVVDFVDYYAVSLLAGQKVTVQAVGALVHPSIGVYDPSGRLIASDWNDVDIEATLGQEFQFVADRPGVYRFAVGNFLPPDIDPEDLMVGGLGDYSLRIQGVGDIGIGGVVAGANLTNVGLGQAAVTLRRGDLGAVVANNSILSMPGNDTIHVFYGSARTVLAGENIGSIAGNTFGNGLELNVPYGHVGLIQSLQEDGILFIANNNNRMIGGNYQVVDAAGTLQAGFAPARTQTFAERQMARGLIARGRIGVIRAGDMATLMPSYIEVNAEANLDPRFGPVTDGGRDGIIDLIDVAGDLGTIQGGGPAIVTNFGGNVRYMIAGGTVYSDLYFSSGEIQTTRLLEDDLVLVDDGGGRINISGARQRNPRYGLIDPVTGLPEPRYLGKAPQVTYRAYPIRGSGGSVLMDISSDRRLEITSLTTQPGGSLATPVEIGRITMTNNAAASMILDPISGLPVQQEVPGGLDMDLILRGPAPIDVLHVQAGIVDVISNVSGGEIGKVTAQQIHNLFSRDIGITRSSTGAAVEPQAVMFDTFPFQDERLGVSANIVGNIAASAAIGPVSISGSINSIVANQDRVDFSPAEFEGIIGPVFVGGEIGYVEIGEGLGSSGNGGFSRGGLYAQGQIRYITNNNGNGSIWGTVASTQRISQIVLNNGSIINANIMVVSDLVMSSDVPLLPVGLSLPDFGTDSSEAPIYEIVNIQINGAGGIIGSRITAADIGNVIVNNGFGILNSAIDTVSDGRVNRIIADGYGIRTAFIGDGASVTEINARGLGEQVNPAAFGRDVRGTAVRGRNFDPQTGFRANRLTDLYQFFNITPNNPYRDNVTNSGIIEDVVAIGNRDLGAVYANRLRHSTFNFGNKIDLIQTRSAINGLTLTTGELVEFHAGSSVLNFEGTVAGPVTDFSVMGDFDENSSLIASGPSGRIYNFRVHRDLAGNVRTTGFLNNLWVGRDVAATGSVQADEIYARFIGGQVLGTITVV